MNANVYSDEEDEVVDTRQWVIVTGNPVSGFQLFGTFPNLSDARVAVWDNGIPFTWLLPINPIEDI